MCLHETQISGERLQTIGPLVKFYSDDILLKCFLNVAVSYFLRNAALTYLHWLEITHESRWRQMETKDL